MLLSKIIICVWLFAIAGDCARPPPFTHTSRIAVIGAGAGGIHMSYLLKKKGYSNIIIYEQNEYIGGKARSVYIEGKSYDAGAILVMKSFTSHLSFIKELGLSANTAVDDLKNAKYDINSQLFSASELYNYLYNGTFFLNVTQIQLYQATVVYSGLYMKMTDEYGYPKEEYAKEFAKPLESFMIDHKIAILTTFIVKKLERFNYGGMQTPMFYVMTLTSRISRGGLSNNSYEYFSKGGFQEMWQKAIDIANLTVKLNHDVKSVVYMTKNKIRISGENGYKKFFQEDFDFVIFAIPNPLSIIQSPTHDQLRILSKYNNYSPIYSVIYKATNNNKLPQSLFNLNQIPGIGLWSKYIDDVSLYVYKTAYLSFPDDKIASKYSINNMDNLFNSGVKDLTKESPLSVIFSKYFNTYNPQCNVEDVENKVPWDLFRLQGKNNMWFLSAFASIDITDSIINYNQKVLDSFGM